MKKSLNVEFDNQSVSLKELEKTKREVIDFLRALDFQISMIKISEHRHKPLLD